MKADVELLRADVFDEIGKLKKVYEEFVPMAEKLDLSNTLIMKRAREKTFHAASVCCEN